MSGVGRGGWSSEDGGLSSLALCWRKLARRVGSGSHAGDRRQKSTTEATISEMPMRAIVVLYARVCMYLPFVGVDWEQQIPTVAVCITPG